MELNFFSTHGLLNAITSNFSLPHVGGINNSHTLNQITQIDKFEASDELLKMIEDFTSGMRMLQKHQTRTNADMDEIAKANLKLLHSNLKAFPEYRSLLSSAKLNPASDNDWQWLSMVSKKNVRAGLLTILKAKPITPNPLYNANMAKEAPKINQKFQQSDGTFRMFYVIKGDILSHQELPTTNGKLTTSPSNYTKTVLNKLQNGDTLLEKQGETRIQRIESLTEQSLLLSVHIPNRRRTQRR